jgi:hypothetical protein
MKAWSRVLLEKLIGLELKKFHTFMELEGSSPFSPEPNFSVYPEPNDFNVCPTILFL